MPTKRMMNKIVKIWYKNLMNASEQQRAEYEISTIGIHWSKLDEDVSFESFAYEEAEPSAFQRFFLEHPEINVAEFAKGIGLNPSLMRNYINGFKKPSKEREQLMVRPGMTRRFFDTLGRKDLRFILKALYLYVIMYINLRALWLLSVLRNYATI